MKEKVEKKEKQETISTEKTEKLYPESKHSLQETLLALLKLKTDENMSNKTFESILSILGDILPEKHTLPSTYFTFESKIESLFGKVNKKKKRQKSFEKKQ